MPFQPKNSANTAAKGCWIVLTTVNERSRLQPDGVVQVELDLEDGDSLADIADIGRLMTTFDTINARYGRGTMTMASAGVHGKQKTWVVLQ